MSPSPGAEGNSPPEKRDVGIQTRPITQSKSSHFGGCVIVWGALGLVAVLFWPLLMGQVEKFWDMLVGREPGFHVPGEIVEDMGIDGVLLFKRHDRDNDGVLSIEEFEPLAHQLKDIKVGIRNIKFDYKCSQFINNCIKTSYVFWCDNNISSF